MILFSSGIPRRRASGPCGRMLGSWKSPSHGRIFIEPIPGFDYNSFIYMIFSKEELFTDPGWFV
jgi:hypothetical protein